MVYDYLKTLPQWLLPKRLLSWFAGRLANAKTVWLKSLLIRWFAKKYAVNMAEALEAELSQYPSFNAFFTRKLKPDCRPIASTVVVSPVDGIISERDALQQGELLQAKGRYYRVEELLSCSKEQAALFENGQFMTIYLSPKDYHRIHMPIAGRLLGMQYVPGRLFSVQPSTVRVIPNLFARNERVVVWFDTPVGKMVMVLVGAVIVGSIGTTWHGDLPRESKPHTFDYTKEHIALNKGDEMGYFKLGSTVVMLFEHDAALEWDTTHPCGSEVRYGEGLSVL